MEVIQWKSGFGYTVRCEQSEYNEIMKWCTENFGPEFTYVKALDVNYHWSSNMMGGESLIDGLLTVNYQFNNEESVVAFKLRWL